MTTRIDNEEAWGRVAAELAAESIKPAVYDHPLIELAGPVAGKNVLDYGAGPGILARALQLLGANTKAYDIAGEMCIAAGKKIGRENVHNNLWWAPHAGFDLVVCNLVLCIVPEDDVETILRNIRTLLAPGSKALIGFCNPLIWNVAESQLDLRHHTGCSYHVNHEFMKTKKEGNYQIKEIHRPIEWYTRAFEATRLKLEGIHFTPEYEYSGRRLNDFVIFELTKSP